jgi:hypothetical protein
MLGFRALLVGLWLVLVGFTAVVIANHGMNLIPIFFGDIAKLGWPGQFNLDFLLFLVLSALWTAWRGGFAPVSLGLAVVALFGGSGFLLPYLLILTLQAKGDMATVLLGVHRPA